MKKIPLDDILEGLSKLKEYESLRNSRPYWNCMTWRFIKKKIGLDYHILKTMVKRSIEQDIRNKNFGARNGNCERNAVVKNQGTKQRVQRILGDCWQWESNGQCSRGDNCSFRHDINKRGKITQPNPSPNSFMQQTEKMHREPEVPEERVPVVECLDAPAKDYLKGICTNSFCDKWHPPECLFYKTKSGCRFAEKCSYAHRRVDEQPSKRSKENDDKSTAAMSKKNDWNENVWQLVVNRDKSNERSGRRRYQP